MSKGGRVNQQQGYQDPFYEGSGQPYNNQPQPGSELGYPPEAESTISREPLQPNYNAPQQGFSSSPGKGVRPSPYRGGFGGGFGGYQPSPYGGGFGGGFSNYQQPSFRGGFGGPAYGQGYGMQGRIGSLLQNYSSYTQPRMPFNPYASNPYLSSGSRGFNSSPGKGMRPQPYGGGFVDMPSPQPINQLMGLLQPINQPSLLTDPKEAFFTSQPSTEPSEPSFFDMFPDAPPPPEFATQDMTFWINPITGQQESGGSSTKRYQNNLKEYLDSNPEASANYYERNPLLSAEEIAEKNVKSGILGSTLRSRY